MYFLNEITSNIRQVLNSSGYSVFRSEIEGIRDENSEKLLCKTCLNNLRNHVYHGYSVFRSEIEGIRDENTEKLVCKTCLNNLRNHVYHGYSVFRSEIEGIKTVRNFYAKLV